MFQRRRRLEAFRISMDSISCSRFWILAAFFLCNDRCFAKSVTENLGNEHNREKRESGCCRDVNDEAQGRKHEDGCCREGDKRHDKDNGNHGGGGGCCRENNDDDDNDNDGQDGDCCQVGHGHGAAAETGCCQNTAVDDPSRYNTGNVQPYGCCQDEGYDNTPLNDVNEDVPSVPLHKEEMMKALLGEAFLVNVKKADENTLLFFSTMLAKLQSYMENLKFQMEEVRNDLHLKFQGFDNWSTHTDRVIDSAIAVVRRRVYEVQWGDKRHSDLKNQRFSG